MGYWRPHPPERSLRLAFLAAAAMMLAMAREAFANGLPAGIGFLPGMAPVDFFFGPLLTVAMAIIERPFFARSGLTPWSLIHSLRANFLSYLLGIVVALVYFALVRTLMLVVSEDAEMLFALLPVLLVVGTIWFEVRVAVSLLAPNRQLRTRWIVVGNIVSNLVLLMFAVIVGFIYSLIDNRVYPFIYRLAEWQALLVVAYLAILAVALLLALGVPFWAILPTDLQRRWGVPTDMPEANSGQMVPSPGDLPVAHPPSVSR